MTREMICTTTDLIRCKSLRWRRQSEVPRIMSFPRGHDTVKPPGVISHEEAQALKSCLVYLCANKRTIFFFSPIILAPPCGELGPTARYNSYSSLLSEGEG